MTVYPFQCPKCRRPTGLKHVSRLNHHPTYGKDAEGERRGSCRFCGHVPDDARLTP